MKKMNAYWKKMGIVLLTAVIATTSIPTGVLVTRAENTISAKSNYVNQFSKAFDALDIVNQERKKAGLNELAMDEELMNCAQIRGREITTCFSHARPDGSSCFSVSDKAMGENIAMGYSSASRVVSGWMASPGHRENILRSGYKSIGIACITYKGRNYWVQVFGYEKANPEVKREDVVKTKQEEKKQQTEQETQTEKTIVSDTGKEKKSKTSGITVQTEKVKNCKVKVKIKNFAKTKKYCVQYSEKSNFKSKKVRFVNKSTVTISKLKKGKTYYFRVLTYKVNAKGKKVYQKNSKIQKIKL